MSSVHRMAPAGPTIYACAQAGCQACTERLLRQHARLVHWVIRHDCYIVVQIKFRGTATLLFRAIRSSGPSSPRFLRAGWSTAA